MLLISLLVKTINKIPIQNHNDPKYLNIVKWFDNILYRLSLPNIIDICLFMIVILIIKIYMKIKKNNKNK